jgi:hypothetical protein
MPYCLFAFTDNFSADDKSLGKLLWLASTCGIQDLDWIYEWRDGGRVMFAFRSEEQLTHFRTKRLLREL